MWNGLRRTKMPKNKDLKRLVRSRMQKTGEAYTTARSHVLAKKTRAKPVVGADFAVIAGRSDDAVVAKTGKTWKQWVASLDAVDAGSMAHRDIAVHLRALGVPGWWAQMVTVGYERIRGLREVGQRCDGKFDASKSKTFAAPVARLYRAFSVKRTRERWLPGVDLKIRTSTVDKSMRISWPDGTSVHAYFTAKGPRKSTVAIQHVGLGGKKDVAARKGFWAERFGELAEVL